jgi:uncharacterized membrane protein
MEKSHPKINPTKPRLLILTVLTVLMLLLGSTVVPLPFSGNLLSGRIGNSLRPRDLGSLAWAAPASQSAIVTYPVSTFNDGKARFYTYKTEDGATIRYFVLKSSDGVIRAAFDACDVCWPEDKGYAQKDDFMICKNCGKRFLSTKVNVITGGCNPSALNRAVQNENVVIQAADILKGKRFFPVKGGKK